MPLDDLQLAMTADAGPSCAHESAEEKPYRPQPSQGLLGFFPALQKYVAYMEWTEKRIEQLIEAKSKAEVIQALSQKKAADTSVDLEKKSEEVKSLRNELAYQHQSVQDATKEKEKWLDEQLVANAKREQQLQAIEKKSERPKTATNTDQKIFDAIDTLSKATEKARVR